MLNYALKRMISAVGIMWAVATIVFFAMRIVPADPAEVVLGDYATPAAIEAFRIQMGLDKPLMEQYFSFLSGLLQGDLGRSLVTNQPVADQIFSLFPYTLSLALAALLDGAAIGIPLGVTTAVYRNTWLDSAGRFFALIGFSMPAFYLGILLLLGFSLGLGWFPIMHTIRTGTLSEHLYKLVLPAFSLGIIQAAYITRLTRSSMLEVMSQDFVRTARAKGLRAGRIIRRHVIPNSMLPTITMVGLEFALLIGSLVVIEQVFSLNGIGRLFIVSITRSDLIMIQGIVIVLTLIFVLVNLLVDFAYAAIDPRIRLG